MDKGLIRAQVIAAAAEHDAALQNEELTVIVGSIELALSGLEENHPSRPWLMDAFEASLKLAQVTDGLLHYSKRFRLGKLSASA